MTSQGDEYETDHMDHMDHVTDTSEGPFESPFEGKLMNEIREQFSQVESDPITGDRIFLDSGGGSLTLKSVIDSRSALMAYPDATGRANPAARYLADRVDCAVNHIHLYLGSGGQGRLVFGLTATDVLFRLIRTLLEQTERGDVVSSGLEHVASRDAAAYWAGKLGRVWTEVSADGAAGLVTPEDYAAAVTPDTALCTVAHTSNVTGLRVDLAGIVKAVRAAAPDCFIVCDGVQHAPHGAINVAAYDVDAYVFAPYKAFSCQGVGVGWIADRVKDIPHDKVLGRPSDHWGLGQRDPGAVCVQSDVHTYLRWLGGRFTRSDNDRTLIIEAMDAAARHERALMHRLLHGPEHRGGLLRMLGVTVLGGDNLMDREGTLSFNVRGMDSADVVAKLNAQRIRTHRRIADAFDGPALKAAGVADVVRISVCHYNSLREIDATLDALASIIENA